MGKYPRQGTVASAKPHTFLLNEDSAIGMPMKNKITFW
jgi:hypothetical protein